MYIFKLGSHCTFLVIAQYFKVLLLGWNGCGILIKYLKLRASLSFLRYKSEFKVLPHDCCETCFCQPSVLSKQFDFYVCPTNCWIKFTAMEKVNDKVCGTHNESLYYTLKQLAVAMWVVLVIFAYYLDKES